MKSEEFDKKFDDGEQDIIDCLDLEKAHRLDDVSKRPLLIPLSEEARMGRMPLPPECLMNTLHDRVHYESGQSRPAKVFRSKK